MVLSTYPKSIDWNSFFKTFRLRNLMLNMSHNHLQLPTVLRLSFSLRILLLTFNFTRERFAIVCLSFTRSAQSCRILEKKRARRRRGCRHNQQRSEKKKTPKLVYKHQVSLRMECTMFRQTAHKHQTPATHHVRL